MATICRLLYSTAANLRTKHGLKFIYRAASTPSIRDSDRFKISILPALKDNYMYVLIDKKLKIATAVDPVEPEKVLKCVNEENVELVSVLTTHHHADHDGGNKFFSENFKSIPIYGGDDRIDCLTNKLSSNEIFKIGEFSIQCLHTPCHTSGHVCFFIQETANPVCFTGDTLFVGGCGRFFEGSAEHMLESLKTLTALPVNTEIYCGHEYTVSNLKFALHVEPNNKKALEALKSAEAKIQISKPTIPSTIEKELSYNPFLRVYQKSIQEFTNERDPVSVMRTLRELKDNFKC